MKQMLITLLLAIILVKAGAQTQFIKAGKIEFEKKVNMHKQLDIEEDEGFRSMIKKMIPPVKTTYFDLFFNNNKTIYKPGREVVTVQKIPEWFDGPANDNTVFTDLSRQSVISQKTVFDDVFNVDDSVRKINWKITADTRTIAGFECRKATAIIMDSVFVIAFYTDQIITSGGPESFSELPGMILGLAIPRLYTTWFATKLETIDINEATLTPPKKGKKTSISNFKQELNSGMKNWGKYRDKNMWQIMI